MKIAILAVIVVAVAACGSSSRPPATASAPLPALTAVATEIDPPDLEDELPQLQHALDALPGDPNRALSLCNEDAMMFPNGLLAQEREMLAITALTHLGRVDEAKARAKKFETDFPHAVGRSLVRKLVED